MATKTKTKTYEPGDTMHKIIVEIEASDWTQDQLDSFRDWLQEELDHGNMFTDDDATVLSVKAMPLPKSS